MSSVIRLASREGSAPPCDGDPLLAAVGLPVTVERGPERSIEDDDVVRVPDRDAAAIAASTGLTRVLVPPTGLCAVNAVVTYGSRAVVRVEVGIGRIRRDRRFVAAPRGRPLRHV